MQFYKFLLLLLLIILIIIVSILPEELGTIVSWSYPVLSFNLSLRVILVVFLFTAFLIILSAKILSFSEMLFLFIYTVSSLCAVLSKKTILLVIFCELMAISASFIIASSQNINSAIRYSCIHFFAGIILMVGLAAQNINLISIGLLINCACFPFSFWVVDAYPAVSLHSTAYLSLFTTKVSFLIMLLHVYSISAEILVFLGSITVIYSIIFAALEQSIRRFLCYNIVGQMGLLIFARGLLNFSEKTVPVLLLHIVFSLSCQSLLFMVANSISSQTKVINFSRVSKLMSAEGIYALIAVLTMVGFPGTAGFISKSCIIAEIEMNNHNLELYKNLYKFLNLLLYLSIGFKFLYYMFIVKGKSSRFLEKKDSQVIMAILALVCVVAGNPYLPIYNKSLIFSFVYSIKNVWSQFILLLFTTLLFIPLRKFFLPRINFKMDVDWTFRVFVPNIALLLGKLLCKVRKVFVGVLQNLSNLLIDLYFSSAIKLGKALNYNSVSFVSASSLFLMGVLLVLLCLNH
ncbi:cation:proton antiporter [Wolbachia endosymbiont of Dipetalonema caudispina]|uniref:proton-conducting transporter transmembrane domain-containing protein n=1 Tax=Wolbachia endosymbiont of Dipetalonema caudispina TaxID=1812112 RepID=UPI00158BC91D|nr:proton-conducting transporter membrane subunit [Wolbachia endosymbiont of Dipetalonema caudispina]QKX00812.1 cation:proton antiporter [Wolbachia endosymbiont of Dipetalonema caudispina]